MALTQQSVNETLRIMPFLLEDDDMLDIRFWRNTKKGPRPTKRGIAIKRSMIVRLIIGLQKMNTELNSDEAKREAAING